MLTSKEAFVKRVFDFTISALLTLILFIPILFFAFIAALATGSNGFFTQERIGQHGKLFMIFKIRTAKGNAPSSAQNFYSKFLRKTKLNELPQLFNILKGDMSFVGPRPDIRGFADELEGEDRIILKVPPGLTGPASLKYRNEEKILAKQENPNKYNREIIWPDKVAINKHYIENWSFKKDIYYIYKTLFPK